MYWTLNFESLSLGILKVNKVEIFIQLLRLDVNSYSN
jgi:hypothetical protein